MIEELEKPKRLKMLPKTTLYVDAGTRNNGKRGFQSTIICVSDPVGNIHFEKIIGDYTINEGEILAILAGLTKVHPRRNKTMFSDSKIAVNWILHGWSESNRRAHEQKVGTAYHKRLAKFIDLARKEFYSKKHKIFWIPRTKNVAGWYLEDKYKI